MADAKTNRIELIVILVIGIAVGYAVGAYGGGITGSATATESSIQFGIGTLAYPSAPTDAAAIIGKGSVADYRLAIQDGSGRVNQYWNAYYASGGHKYQVSNEGAERIMMGNGVFSFQVAPLGTAGAAVPWKTALYIDNDAEVGIGTANPTATLEVNGSAAVRGYFKVSTPRGYVGSIVAIGDDYRGGILSVSNENEGVVKIYGNLSISSLRVGIYGNTNAYACLNSNGMLYRSTTPCA